MQQLNGSINGTHRGVNSLASLHLELTQLNQTFDSDLNYILEHIYNEQLFTTTAAKAELQDYSSSNVAILEVQESMIQDWSSIDVTSALDTAAQTIYSDPDLDFDMVIAFRTDSKDISVAASDQSKIDDVEELVLGEGSGDTALEGIRDNSRKIKEISTRKITSTVVPKTPPAAQQATPVIVGAIGSLILIGTISAVAFNRPSKKHRLRELQDIKDINRGVLLDDAPELASTPEDFTTPESDFEKLIITYENVALQHKYLPQSGLSEELEKYTRTLRQLNQRLKSLPKEHTRDLAELELVTFNKVVVKSIGSDYYMDIVQNPEFWDRSQERLAEVESALEKVEELSKQVMIQINKNQDISLRVGLESILQDDLTFGATG